MHRRALTALVLSASAALALSACGGNASDTASSASKTASSAVASATDAASSAADSQGSGLSVESGWVKASDKKMTGAFGTLKNSTGAPIHIVKATSPVSPMVELHETVKDSATGQMVMRETKDGFTVPAGGTFELKPGGNHVMLMGLTSPIKTGDTTKVTLVAEDGKQTTVELEVREFTGADESYQSGHGEMSGTMSPSSMASMSSSSS
ncbi:MAG: copper chaperone PCu(A)C [Micrococcales bacterium]|nr:copper chaperone PCu(A)C [Micrococcales bacterium]